MRPQAWPIPSIWRITGAPFGVRIRPLPTPDLGGHLHDFAVPHEPDIHPGVHDESAPLVIPESIDIDIARQSHMLGNCFP